MQLRVARLCLDCEELHVDNRCPRCASERYAFLSTWLPSEERRRWRRPQAQSAEHGYGLAGVAQTIARWFRGEHAPKTAGGPLTRAADHAATLKFNDPADAPAKPRHVDTVAGQRTRP